ncbi:MAG: CPBP family intramembrane glutamic endopeptidase [Myxococcota bacterium]
MTRSKVVAFYGVMLAAAFGVGAWQRSLTHWLPRPEDVASHAALGVAAGLLVVALSRFAQRRFHWARALSNEFQSMLSGFSRRDAFMMALMSALGEELMFRGVVQRSFSDPVFGVVLTAGIFAALHVGPSKTFVPWTMMAFVVGLMFGALALVTGDLLAPVLAHGVINFLNLREILGPDEPELTLGPLGGDPMVDEAL